REALGSAPGRTGLPVLAAQTVDEVGGRVGELVLHEEGGGPRRLDPNVGEGVGPQRQLALDRDLRRLAADRRRALEAAEGGADLLEKDAELPVQRAHQP